MLTYQRMTSFPNCTILMTVAGALMVGQLALRNALWRDKEPLNVTLLLKSPSAHSCWNEPKQTRSSSHMTGVWGPCEWLEAFTHQGINDLTLGAAQWLHS